MTDNIDKLCAMPHWEFCIVMGEGFFSEPCAGMTRNGVYYSEREIYFAYFKRYPDGEALV